MTPEELDAHVRLRRVIRKYRCDAQAKIARTHEPTIKDRLEYWWFCWGNDICKVAFVVIMLAWALFTLWMWGPMIRSGLGSYLNG